MRSKRAIVFLFVLISLVSVRDASAGWGVAFMQWLESLDPGPFRGIGPDVDVACVTTATGKRCERFIWEGPRILVEASAGLLFGKQDATFGKAVMIPLSGVVEYAPKPQVSFGGGVGWFAITGIPAGTIKTTYPVLRVTLTPGAGTSYTGRDLHPARYSFRLELVRLPGFDAGVFGNNSHIGPEYRGLLSIIVR